MQIRPAILSDLPQIFAIYNEQVLHGTATFDTVPKDPVKDVDWMALRNFKRHPVLVAEAAGEILGWAALSPWSPRQAYERTAENSVYIRHDQQGQGLGKALLSALIETARTNKMVAVFIARIVEGNPASLKLHQSFGFQEIGAMRRCGEKFGRLLDVVLMDLHLDGDF